jgi:hypothetical protein
MTTHPVEMALLILAAGALFAYNTYPYYAAWLFRPRARDSQGIFRAEVFFVVESTASSVKHYQVFQRCYGSLEIALKRGAFYAYIFKRMHPKHAHRVHSIAVAKMGERLSIAPLWAPTVAKRSSQLPQLRLRHQIRGGAGRDVFWQPGMPEEIWELDSPR